MVYLFFVCDLSLSQDAAPAKKLKSSSPQVYFDITIGGKPSGRIVMELRPDIVPKTAGVYH